MNKGLLLDTCALIWLMNKNAISEPALREIRKNARLGEVYIAIMSAWEIAMLESKNRIGLSLPANLWFQKACNTPGLSLADLDPEILIHSAQLPGNPPADPVDRMIIAQSRLQDLTLITRDAAILEYAAKGYVNALAC